MLAICEDSKDSKRQRFDAPARKGTFDIQSQYDSPIININKVIHMGMRTCSVSPRLLAQYSSPTIQDFQTIHFGPVPKFQIPTVRTP